MAYVKKKDRISVSVRLPGPLIEAVRDAAYWTPGLTVQGVFEEALTAYLRKLEKRRGDPFPPRKGSRSGRPIR